MYKSFIFLLFFIQSLFCNANTDFYYVDYNAKVSEIYQDIICLKLIKAKKDLTDLKIKQEHNLAILHLENYIDFLDLFISEDSKIFDKLKKNKAKRIHLIKKHLPQDNAYRNFLLADINLQWALVRSKQGEFLKAGQELYLAYQYLLAIQNNFPSFVYHKKTLSCIHAIVESFNLPIILKQIFNLNSSIDLAESEIESFILNQENNIFTTEANIIYSYILNYQKLEHKKALDHIQTIEISPSKSPLITFHVAQLAQQSGENELALQVLKQSPKNVDYANFPYLDFMVGLCKLRKCDQSAEEEFKSFIQNFNGNHYIKEAYQKLAWSAIIFDQDESKYKHYISKVNESGSSMLDGDKAAQKEYEQEEIPNRDLLIARVLFDGGYYNRALNQLNKYEKTTIANNDQILYRKARIYQKMKNYNLAIELYTKLLDNNSSDGNYIYCNASLQLGILNENLGQHSLANKFYQICLEYNPEIYKRSLHQKARSGIDRIEKW